MRAVFPAVRRLSAGQHKTTPMLLICAIQQRIGVDVCGYGFTASATLPPKHQPNKLLKLPVAPGATKVAAFKAP